MARDRKKLRARRKINMFRVNFDREFPGFREASRYLKKAVDEFGGR